MWQLNIFQVAYSLCYRKNNSPQKNKIQKISSHFDSDFGFLAFNGLNTFKGVFLLFSSIVPLLCVFPFIYLLLFRHILVTLATEVRLENWKRKRKKKTLAQASVFKKIPPILWCLLKWQLSICILAKFVDIQNMKIKNLELPFHALGG